MNEPEKRQTSTEVPPQETISTLALVKEKLKQLDTEGKIHFVGIVGPDDKKVVSHSPHVEQVDIYIALVNPLFPAMAGKPRQLMEKSKEIAHQIGIGRSSLSMHEGNAKYGSVTFMEKVAERASQPEAKLLVEDVSQTLKKELGITTPAKAQSIMRFVDIRVYENLELAELKYVLNTGSINRKEYNKLRRKIDHPKRAELFNRLNPRHLMSKQK
jgi:hypothetical protein